MTDPTNLFPTVNANGNNELAVSTDQRVRSEQQMALMAQMLQLNQRFGGGIGGMSILLPLQQQFVR